MLTFEEKLAIIEDFPQLTRKEVSLGRVNFQFDGSNYEKKNVVYHLHPNGNGFVYAGLLTGYETDSKGLVNIRDFTEKALRNVLERSISSLSETNEEEGAQEQWVNDNGFILRLIKEGDLWNIYADEFLDGTFRTYVASCSYLEQEGFRKKY